MTRHRLLPENVHTIAQWQRLRVYGKSQHILTPGFAAHSGIFVLVSVTLATLGSAGTFAFGEAIWPLLNALQAEELLLPLWSTDPSDCAACSWGIDL